MYKFTLEISIYRILSKKPEKLRTERWWNPSPFDKSKQPDTCFFVMPVKCWDPIGSGATCKCLKLTATLGQKVLCMLKWSRKFQFFRNILQYLPTRFNKSRTQDVNSSNDAIKNLKVPVLWSNFIHQRTILSAWYMNIFEQWTIPQLTKILISTSLGKIPS
jgi:hypothetical protein